MLAPPCRISLTGQTFLQLGGVYLYANQQGCDGDRLYYDGCPLIACNGNIVGQGSQFSLDDVQTITATIDLDEIRAARASKSRGMQAVTSNGINQARGFKRIRVDFELRKGEQRSHDGATCHLTTALQNIGASSEDDSRSTSDLFIPRPSTKPIETRYHLPEEEIALGPACWLWDYLRRSRTQGYFIPLSGGIDSCATSVIVFSMCRQVVKACREGNEQVLNDVRRICGEGQGSKWIPKEPQEVSGKLFVTCYMGTENSSQETRTRARKLAEAIGS